MTKPMTREIICKRVEEGYYDEDGGFIRDWLINDLDAISNQAKEEAHKVYAINLKGINERVNAYAERKINAAREEALEEAAKVVESMECHMDCDCANQIRALKSKPTD